MVGRSVARIALVSLLPLVGACGNEPTGSALPAGALRYTVTDESGPQPPTTWEGEAMLDPRAGMFIEFEAGRLPDGHTAWWSLAGSSEARAVGTHPIVGDGGWAADTLQLRWGHLVDGDPATEGEITFTRVDGDRIDGHFRYRGRAGRGTDTVFAVVEGEFSAIDR